MLEKNFSEIQSIMNNIVNQGGIRKMYIMNIHDEIRFAPGQRNVGTVFTRTSAGCIECHRPQVSQHSLSIIFTNAQNKRVFRNCKPIVNLPECQVCHSTQDEFAGVLVTDISMQGVDDSLAADLKTNILWSSTDDRGDHSGRECSDEPFGRNQSRTIGPGDPTIFAR